MAERTIALSIDKLFDGNHNHPGIAEFISGFSNAIHSGDGSISSASNAFKVDASFPLRVLVGMPKKLLTRDQKILTEAYCSYHFGLPLRAQADLWHARQGWKPNNPNRVIAPLPRSELDGEWMLSLGISRATWEKSVLIAPGALSKKNQAAGHHSPLDGSVGFWIFRPLPVLYGSNHLNTALPYRHSMHFQPAFNAPSGA